MKNFLIKDKVDREEITIEHCPPDRADVDGLKHKAEAGSCLSGFQGTCHGLPR